MVVVSHVKMERWKSWLCFNFKSSFFFPTKGIIVKVTSRLGHKAKENRQGLVSLYKDMEACEGYEDIQVMWEMIHSSCPPNDHNTRSSNRTSHRILCFRPT